MHALQLQKMCVQCRGPVLMEAVDTEKYFEGGGNTDKLINLMVQVIFVKTSVQLCF